MRARLRHLLPSQRGTELLLVLLDVLAVVVSAVVVLPVVALVPLLVAAAATLLVAHGAGLYRPRLVLSVVEDLPALLLAAVVSPVVLGGADQRLGLRTASLADVVALGAATFAALVLLRTGAFTLTHVLRRTGAIAHPTLVVGTDPVGRQVAEALLDRREHGLLPRGMVDAGPPGTLRGLPLPLLGGLADLDRLVCEHEIDHLVFTFPAAPDSETVAVVRTWVARGLQVLVVPRFLELAGVEPGQRTEHLRDLALVRMHGAGRSPALRAVQRTLDVVVALGGLVVLSPVLLLIALAVRVEGGPGVLYHQIRVGYGGRRLTLLKFRTLRAPTFGEGTTTWSIDNDSRLGPVGRFLRRTGLDELPQLVNVLRGELSLVGPQPGTPALIRRRRRATEPPAPATFSVPTTSLREDVRSVLVGLVPPMRQPDDVSGPGASRPGAGRPAPGLAPSGRRRG